MKANLQRSDALLSFNIQRRVPFGNVQITGSLKKTSWGNFWLGNKF